MEKYKGLYKNAGFLDKKELRTMYRKSSVLVLPTLAEGSALVVYEAMACGLPVVVTPNAGSVARDGVDGYIIPPRDAKAITSKLHILCKNRDMRKKMGLNACEHSRRFTWNKRGDELHKVIKSLKTHII